MPKISLFFCCDLDLALGASVSAADQDPNSCFSLDGDIRSCFLKLLEQVTFSNVHFASLSSLFMSILVHTSYTLHTTNQHDQSSLRMLPNQLLFFKTHPSSIIIGDHSKRTPRPRIRLYFTTTTNPPTAVFSRPVPAASIQFATPSEGEPNAITHWASRTTLQSSTRLAGQLIFLPPAAVLLSL